jgi:hypothetical protein
VKFETLVTMDSDKVPTSLPHILTSYFNATFFAIIPLFKITLHLKLKAYIFLPHLTIFSKCSCVKTDTFGSNPAWTFQIV